MDKVFISGLQITTLIGIYPEERKMQQSLLVDIELSTDTRKASASDAIANAIDYDALALRLQQLAQSSQFSLLETLAEHLAQSVLREFPAQGVRLRIHKPWAIRNALATAKAVGIEIVRGDQCH